MLRKIEKTIKAHGLISKGDHVLLGVSGGSDSVAMAYALHHLRNPFGFSLSVAHLNHAIRGKAADDDESFVRELAWRLSLPCVTEKADVPKLAAETGLSLEMAARQARYDFFKRTAASLQASVLATAHTADDQAETVLLRIARGAGTQGLAGIPYQAMLRGLRVIRPLRDARHQDTINFLHRHRLSWKEDTSNTDTDFLRNRVRHEILPILESRLNPRIRQALVRTGEVLGEENAWLDQLTRRIFRKCVRAVQPQVLKLGSLSREPVAARRRILRLWLFENGVQPEAMDFKMIDRLMDLSGTPRGTREIPLGQGWKVVQRYHELLIKKSPENVPEAFSVPLNVPGETLLLDQGLRAVARWREGPPIKPAVHIGALPSEVVINAAAVGRMPMVLRSWRAGDRINPLGMQGSKKIQDLFVDGKIPRDQRPGIPVLECRGAVVWVAGYRVAKGWEVKNPRQPSLHVFIDRIDRIC
ncbi:MAG: tRNA lysidine(34) synthetase TilS [Lentisphaerota bacterium]